MKIFRMPDNVPSIVQPQVKYVIVLNQMKWINNFVLVKWRHGLRWIGLKDLFTIVGTWSLKKQKAFWSKKSRLRKSKIRFQKDTFFAIWKPKSFKTVILEYKMSPGLEIVYGLEGRGQVFCDDSIWSL